MLHSHSWIIRKETFQIEMTYKYAYEIHQCILRVSFRFPAAFEQVSNCDRHAIRHVIALYSMTRHVIALYSMTNSTSLPACNQLGLHCLEVDSFSVSPRCDVIPLIFPSCRRPGMKALCLVILRWLRVLKSCPRASRECLLVSNPVMTE
jgi:hypothetical protein